jgi:hypothetical protein
MECLHFGITTAEELAEWRYRRYRRQKLKESLMRQLAELPFRLLKALARMLQGTRIIKKRNVEKVNVE